MIEVIPQEPPTPMSIKVMTPSKIPPVPPLVKGGAGGFCGVEAFEPMTTEQWFPLLRLDGR